MTNLPVSAREQPRGYSRVADQGQNATRRADGGQPRRKKKLMGAIVAQRPCRTHRFSARPFAADPGPPIDGTGCEVE
jgi:hypothetical protein